MRTSTTCVRLVLLLAVSAAPTLGASPPVPLAQSGKAAIPIVVAPRGVGKYPHPRGNPGRLPESPLATRVVRRTLFYTTLMPRYLLSVLFVKVSILQKLSEEASFGPLGK